MKPGIPWSIKGIDQQAREMAKYAARRSGMTLGEWLNSVILETAGGDDDLDRRYGKPPSIPQVSPDASTGENAVKWRLDQLARQLNALSTRDTSTAVARVAPAAAITGGDQAALRAIIERLEKHELVTAASLDAVQQRLDEVTERLASRFPERLEDIPGYPALEGALRSIVDYIEVSETRTRDAVNALQKHLLELTEWAREADKARPDFDAAAMARIERRLVELSERIDHAEAEPSRELHDRIHAQVATLASEIEALQQTGDSVIQKVQAVAVQAAQREISEAEQRLQALVAEAKRAIRSSDDLDNELSRLRAEVDSLKQRYDQIKFEAASEQEVKSLMLAIEQLSTTLAERPKLQPLTDLERRLAELARRLEEQDASHPAQGQLAERLTAAEQRLDHLAVIERSVAQLAQSVEESRGWANSLADEAANRVAEKLLADGSLRHPSGPSPELIALEEGLQAVRASAELADERTQETLKAVHETLEQVIDKLGELEAAADRRITEAEAGTLAAGAFRPAPTQGGGATVQPVAAPVREDYIAAARRAAAETARLRPDSPATDRGIREDKPAAGTGESAFDRSKRNRLILAGLVLLTAVAAFGINRLPEPDTARAPAGAQVAPESPESDSGETARQPSAPAPAADELAPQLRSPEVPDRRSGLLPAEDILPNRTPAAAALSALVNVHPRYPVLRRVEEPEALSGRKLIRRAQELLAGMGYDIGCADGVMCARTVDAIRLFQQRMGLKIDGMVTNDLVRALQSRRI